MNGCFFFLPLLEEEPNMPPVIEFSYPEADEVFHLDSPAGSVAWIAVTDPDKNDTVEYLWTIDGLGAQGSASAFVNQDYRGSAIRLTADSVYDDRNLVCTVFDSKGASAQVSWLIEVAEGVNP
jgi:hypothetical protein